jgi:hypothetical protein
MIIGLNPSIADETKNDPTIIRCIDFAKTWGYGGSYKNRSKEILSKIENSYYLKLNKNGELTHPLYLAGNLIPIKLKSN